MAEINNLTICQKSAIYTLWQAEEEIRRIQETEKKVHRWNRD